VTPQPGDLNLCELVERDWFAGVVQKIICDLGSDARRKPQFASAPKDAQHSTGPGNSTQSPTDAKVAACVDMLLPHASSSMRQAYIRHAVQSQAAAGRSVATAPASARLEYQSSGDDSSGPEYPLTSEPDVRGNMQGMESDTYVTVVYNGSPADTGSLNPRVTGEVSC
jgi:hypothetical protein